MSFTKILSNPQTTITISISRPIWTLN